VRPERDVRAREVPPQDIQALVPGVQLLVVGALEARTAEPKRLDVVAEVSSDDFLGDVRRVGDVLGRRTLPTQCQRSVCAQHGRPRAAPITTVTFAARQPRPSGRSSVNGL